MLLHLAAHVGPAFPWPGGELLLRVPALGSSTLARSAYAQPSPAFPAKANFTELAALVLPFSQTTYRGTSTYSNA